MKLRILDNSIRLRLDRSEVRQLLREGLVQRRTAFGPSSAFVYALHAVAQEVELVGQVGPSRIDVFVDVTRAARWAGSEETTIEAHQPAGAAALKLVIEKDFPCRHTDPGENAEKFTPETMRIDEEL